MIVLVVAFTVFKDPIGVGQTGVTELRCERQGVVRLRIVHTGVHAIIVHQSEAVVTQVAYIVSIGINEGGLRQTEDVGGGDVAVCIALCPSVVTEVVSVAHIGHVQFGGEALEEIHIGVEADVQAVECVVLGRGLCIGVTQREVIHGDIVTTLHTYAIVLRNGGAVKILCPIGIVMELLIIQVTGIFVQEGDDHRRGKLISTRGGAEELCQVVAVLTGVHHARALGRKFYSSERTDVDAGGLRMSALGGDFQHTVGALCTIDGRTVAEHFYTFDIFRIDQIEDVVIETVVQSGTSVLHIPNHSIDNHERLCIGIE